MFDHLNGQPEDRVFSRVAHQMRRGSLKPGQYEPLAWWQIVPERDEPSEVSGEIQAKPSAVKARVLHVGFTGTRHGLTEPQRASLKLELDWLTPLSDSIVAHHGYCVGGDVSFHYIVRAMPNSRIIAHPGPDDDTVLRANCEADELRPGKPFMARNHDIVNESHVMLACPPTDEPNEYGGTWRTIRLATKALTRGKLRELIVIGRNGQRLSHGAWK